MKNIVITGSSTGIGKATVQVLGRAGHRVFATMRNVNDGKPLIDLARRENLQIEVLALDVASDDFVDQAFESISKHVTSIDTLICNAGIIGFGAVEEIPIQRFSDCMDVNYLGTIRCVKKVIAGMRERQSGTIITVSSIGGRVAVTPNSAYAASKFALEAFSEILAQEAKSFGIRVAIVEPGSMATAIADKSIKGAPTESRYPQLTRLTEALNTFSSIAEAPEVVAEQIREIVEGNSWQLRYLVGADAQPLIDMRNNISDEDWVDLQSLAGEAYESAMTKLLSGKKD